ncbi:ribonucleotide reductase large subunit [Murid herpesvirus 3]|uniref:Ribonucleotide reductase large subunit n=2 Tax=Murid betaherpesvirus 3 TaxID=2560603 RepID=A0A1P8VIS1_9BETA|nr:ribonucleotide reductase large subunit [Murine roseolovirus]APZ76235.1 ribonucleotide reductase large subunit [Murid betaherpesvirus 3]AYH64734.1 ribonucleotide reductase large subunit [Murid herpesvirus 3]
MQACLFGRYGIKGFQLKHDIKIWYNLIELEYKLLKLPTSYPRAHKIISLLNNAEFVPDFKPELQAISKLAVIILYSSMSLYNLKDKISLCYWCRYCAECLNVMFGKFHDTLKDLESEDYDAASPLLSLIKDNTFQYDPAERSSLFFRYDFYQTMQDIYIECMMMMCGCDECRRIFFNYKNKKNDEIFMSVYCDVFPELGILELPILPHFGVYNMKHLKDQFKKDLCLSLIYGQVKKRRFPLKFDFDPDKINVYVDLLTMLGNIVFMLYVVNKIHAAVKKENSMYKEFVDTQVKVLVEWLQNCKTIGTIGCFSDPFRSRLGKVYSTVKNTHIFDHIMDFLIPIVRNGMQLPDYFNFKYRDMHIKFLKHVFDIERDFVLNCSDLIAADNLTHGYMLISSDVNDVMTSVFNGSYGLSDMHLANFSSIDGILSFAFEQMDVQDESNDISIFYEEDSRIIQFQTGCYQPVSLDGMYFTK